MARREPGSKGNARSRRRWGWRSRAGAGSGRERQFHNVTQSLLADTRRRVRRAAAVRRWWQEDPDEQQPANLTGLAFSGGGIRSATFSLGAIQALARSKRDALTKIDIVSSVSGGGYIACFLRSLFMPDRGRGIVAAVDIREIRAGYPQFSDEELADQYAFAKRVLASGTHERDLYWPEEMGDHRPPAEDAPKRRNPLWWLREHSRYLAPNGPTDYGYAVAQIARNWLTMIGLFLLAALAAFSALALAEGGARLLARAWLHLPAVFDWTWIRWGKSADQVLACGRCEPGKQLTAPFSPLFAFTIPPAIVSVVLGIAYWMTQAMSPNEASLRRQRRNLAIAFGAAIVAGTAIVGISEWLLPGSLKPDVLLHFPPPGSYLIWMTAAGLVLTAAGAAVALIMAFTLQGRAAELTIEMRSRTTSGLARSNKAVLYILVVALVDTLGAGLATWTGTSSGELGGTAAILSPALAWLIKKLPDWFGGPNKGNIFALLQRFLGTVSLVAGILLYGMLAIAAAALVHSMAWNELAWKSDPNWHILFFLFGLSLVMVLLSGLSTGLINLTSLHSFYASRLTRAYLGATNNERLEAAASRDGPGITDSDGADYIQAEIYCRSDLPAPLHIINTTINETIDPDSQLVARDRKGDVLSVEPGGIGIGRDEFVKWEKLGRPKCAEQLSLGQWCAISGAAASSGMGRLTNLGFALAFTFANVRLGYWWWSPGVCDGHKVAMSPPMRLVASVLGTYVYLADEMTARYSRGYKRKYLTDGGHFENSGAYRLIERRVPLILVCDNGADPKYRFEDLENLVRKVRLDLGADMKVLGGVDLEKAIARFEPKDRSIFVDSEKPGDWRDNFTDPESAAFVLAIEVRFEASATPLHLLWLKPRLVPGLPPDLIGYASSNPPFPQQPTGDQFFDEAQWESYRKLGDLGMERLLEHCPGLLEAAQ